MPWVDSFGSGQLPLAFPYNRVCWGVTDPGIAERVVPFDAGVFASAPGPFKVTFTDVWARVLPHPHEEGLVAILIGDDRARCIGWCGGQNGNPSQKLIKGLGLHYPRQTPEETK